MCPVSQEHCISKWKWSKSKNKAPNMEGADTRLRKFYLFFIYIFCCCCLSTALPQIAPAQQHSTPCLASRRNILPSWGLHWSRRVIIIWKARDVAIFSLFIWSFKFFAVGNSFFIFPNAPFETANTGTYTEQCDSILHSIFSRCDDSNFLGTFSPGEKGHLCLSSYLGCLRNHCAVWKE